MKMADRHDHEIPLPCEESDDLPATQQRQICLGCGGDAVLRNRRVLSGDACTELLPYFKFIISRWLSCTDYDCERLDELINKSYLCKGCFTAYQKVTKLYNMTEKSVSYIISQLGVASASMAPLSCASGLKAPSKRSASTGEINVAKKRRISEGSPSVTVSRT